jgi:hypothetical protein
LGAPLLKELLSEHAIDEVKLRYHDKPTATSDTGVRLVRIFPKGMENGMWRDAEQFMDYVDVARVDPVRAELLHNLDIGLSIRPHEWAAALKRFVAARVSTFLQGANLESESWQPYLRWARALHPEDSVITFNWDRVLELIAEYHADLGDAVPRRLGDPVRMSLKPKSFIRADPSWLRVLKLHGSVDWKRRGATYDVMNDVLTALDCQAEEIALASPGPSKLDASEGFLKPLWAEAKTALSQAAAVVFVGYRFPPSDSLARESLLDGLSAPSGFGGVRAIHTVLGPDVRGEDSARLAGLIRGMLDGLGWWETGGVTDGQGPLYTFRQHPLYGQDFMSIFSRDRILEPLPKRS